MIDLYASGTPNGLKVAIMLEWTGLPYRIITVSPGGADPKPPTFLDASPLGKIPAIRDANATIAESGAILVHLAEKAQSALLPVAPTARANVLMWHFMASATIGPALGQAHHYLHFNAGKAPYAEDRCRAEVQRYYAALEERLSRSTWLAGEAPSIADIALWPWTVRHEWQGVDMTDYPGVRRWYVDMAGTKAVVDGFEALRQTRDIPMPK